VRWDIAAWKPAGDKLYGHIREGDEEETELEIVREKCVAQTLEPSNNPAAHRPHLRPPFQLETRRILTDVDDRVKLRLYRSTIL
jgi:hypothetical protein